jgi:hypothetical protein
VTAPMPPEDADSTNREKSAAQVDAEFAVIVSGIAHQMSWSTTDDQPDRSPARPEEMTADDDGASAARERERRRALRRAERAAEVAAFEEGRAEAQAEMQADDAHFVPPDPPPVPRPKRRTVVALLLLAVGLLMLIRPGLIEVAPDAVLVLGIAFVIGGFSLLIHGLRPRASDPDDADGWDDGARL